MNETLIRVAIFSIGVGVGVMATRRYFDDKYQKLADEEINSCKAIFEKKKLVKEEKLETEVVDGVVYAKNILSQNNDNAVSYSDYYAPKKVDEAQTLSPKEDEPFDISVEEFEEDTEFLKVTLNLYTEDGVLIFEESEEIADEDGTIGAENVDDFARSSFATAYFRNPKTTIDYEIIKVDGSYRELIAGDI